VRIYNITPEKRRFSLGEMDVLSLGEYGRGRKLVLVPFHAEFDPNTNDYDVIFTSSGKPKIVRTGKPSKGWLARINTEGVYTKNSVGYAMVLRKHVKNVEVVAVGYGAYGAAGRAGKWYDYLVKIKPNTLIRVKKSGGYKTPPFYLYFTDDKVLKIREEEIVLFEEKYNITIPPMNSDTSLFSKGLENWIELDPILIEKVRKYEESKNLTTKEVLDRIKGYRGIAPFPIDKVIPEWKELPEIPKALKELIDKGVIKIVHKEYMGKGKFYRYWITPTIK